MLNTLLGNPLQLTTISIFKQLCKLASRPGNQFVSRATPKPMNVSGSKTSSNGETRRDPLEPINSTTSLSTLAVDGTTSNTSVNDATPSLFKSSLSTTSIKSIRSNNLTMKIYPIRALQDNYMYLLVDETTHQAAAVDPVNASAIASAVVDYGVELKAILTTHHHHDHAHGNSDMLAMFPDLIVYGGDTRIQALTRAVGDRETIKVGNLAVQCLHTPCHTKGHVCYFVTGQPTSQTASETDSQVNMDVERAVFTGDTLFIAGCGRFFEGSSEQMNKNLNKILGKLPEDTRVYCGHEYTVNNLKFALSVEPQNPDIKLKLEWAQSKVAKREPTVPSTIGEEKRINPFMRLKNAQVRKFTGETEELEVMTVLRHRKNEFQA